MRQFVFPSRAPKPAAVERRQEAFEQTPEFLREKEISGKSPSRMAPHPATVSAFRSPAAKLIRGRGYLVGKFGRAPCDRCGNRIQIRLALSQSDEEILR